MVAQLPHISILLYTRNGSEFLNEQLNSLTQQSYPNWSLIVSDDGSHDSTLDILQNHPACRDATFLQGPQQGTAANFLHALKHVPPHSYAAFCDQDDVWIAEKLSRAVRYLSRERGPAMYAANRFVTNRDLTSPHRQNKRASTFTGLMFRNRCAGHTAVFNTHAVWRMQAMLPTRAVPFHDWWAALAVTGMGGRYIHDDEPVLFYRQHSNRSLGAGRVRFKLLLNGTYSKWVNANISALSGASDWLTPDARASVKTLFDAQGAPPWIQIPTYVRQAKRNPKDAALAAIATL